MKFLSNIFSLLWLFSTILLAQEIEKGSDFQDLITEIERTELIVQTKLIKVEYLASDDDGTILGLEYATEELGPNMKIFHQPNGLEAKLVSIATFKICNYLKGDTQWDEIQVKTMHLCATPQLLEYKDGTKKIQYHTLSCPSHMGPFTFIPGSSVINSHFMLPLMETNIPNQYLINEKMGLIHFNHFFSDHYKDFSTSNSGLIGTYTNHTFHGYHSLIGFLNNFSDQLNVQILDCIDN